MKRCVITTDRLRLSAGPPHTTTIFLVPPLSSESRHTDGHGDRLKSTQRKDINEEREDRCRGIKTPTASTRGHFLGQLIERAVWVLSATGAEELLSLAIQTAAHSGRWDEPTDPRAEKDRSSGLHRLLLTARIEGKCDAPKHTDARVRSSSLNLLQQ